MEPSCNSDVLWRGAAAKSFYISVLVVYSLSETDYFSAEITASDVLRRGDAALRCGAARPPALHGCGVYSIASRLIIS